LSKPCDADELRRAITRAFALRDLLGNARLKQLTTRIKNLPTLPALQNQLAEELQKNSPSMECVGEIISRDIAMTAKILQFVNSAFFGLAQPINNPVEAAIYLGLNTIHSLVLSAEFFSRYDQETCRAFSLEALAQHSWLTGGLARRVAQVERQEIKIIEQCFLAGLLHDVGQLILACGLPEEYAEVILKARSQKIPVCEVEQEFFGATHAEVGAYLLALWGLSNPITEAVALHHQPARCATPEFSPTVAVHAANVFAHEISPAHAGATPPQLDTAHLASLGFAGRIELWRNNCAETSNLETVSDN
jgi:HD-like signal output (HDOD) protein